MRRLLPLLGLALLAPARASAEVILRDIRWHLSPRVKGESRKYLPIDRWEQAPAKKLAGKPRAVLTVVNRGPKPADGVLLRYAVSARLVRVGEADKPGVWTVPFWVEDRRIMRLKPNEAKDVPIDNLTLDIFLRKMLLAGYWPDMLRIQAIVEPKAGETLDQRLLDKELPVGPPAASVPAR